MTERQMFELSFQRPSNYFNLSGEEQWAIDKQLGILDWAGEDLTEEDMIRFNKHYRLPRKVYNKNNILDNNPIQ